MSARLFAPLAALVLVGGSALADVPGSAPSAAAPSPAPSIDPVGRALGGRTRVDLFGPFHADAHAKPAVESSVVPAIGTVGSACSRDSECADRIWCDKGSCVAITQRTWALFYFHEEGGERGYRYVVPFYWHLWSPNREHRWLLPIFGEVRNGDQRIGAAPLLLSGWSSNRKSGDWVAVVLAHGYFSRDAGKLTAVVFPIVWHFSDPKSSTTVVLPLLILGRDKQRESRSITLLPLFHYQHSEKEKQRLFLTLLGGYSQNDEQGVKQFIGIVPPLYHRSDRRRTVDLVFPLVLRWKDREDHTTTTVVGPFVHHRDLEGTTDVLAPIFWRFHDRANDATTTLLFPFALTHTSATARGGIVGPGFFYRGGEAWAGGLFPLLFLQNADGRSHQILLPLFLHRRDRPAGTDTTAVLNFYFRKTRDGWDGGFVPLVFAGRHDDVKYASVAGLYFFRGDRHGQTHVFGPLYASSNEKSYAFGLAPFINFSAERGKHTSWMFPPLFFHTDDEKAATAFTMIGPVFRNVSGRELTEGIFPLAFGVRRGPRRWDVVLPLFAHFHDDERKKDDLWILDYLRVRDEKRASTTHLLFPFFVKHDEPNYHVTVQFPFFWQVKEAGETDTVVFPLYGRVRRPGYKVDVLFPLVWRFAGQDSNTTVAGPFYFRSHGARSDGGVAPLFGWGGTPGKRYVWALPIAFWHQHDHAANSSRTIVAGFLWERNGGDWTTTIVPLWWAWKRGTTTRAVAAPFIFHSSDDVEGTSLSVIGPFYVGHDPHGRSAGLIPFVFTRTHDDGRWSATIPPLLHVARKSDGFRLLTPLFGVSTYPTGNRGFIGPIYWRHENDGYTASLIPIFYHAHDRLDGTTTTLLLPLFFRSVTHESSLTAITPLVWRYATIESGTTFALPLFFDYHLYHEARTTGLLPFYVRNHRIDEHATSHVIPPLLLYVRRAPEGTDVVLFPILWRFVGNGDVPSRTTVVAPLFWNFRRGTSTTQVLFPLYMKASRESADYTLVLNFFYRRGKGLNQGSYYLNVFPFFDYSRPRPHDLEWNIFGGLVGYSRIGKTRTLKLFFAIETPLAPSTIAATSSPTGSFFTSTSTGKSDLF